MDAPMRIVSPVYHFTIQFREMSCTDVKSIFLSFYFCLTICAPRVLCKRLISYGLFHNASLVNNVPVLIRESWLIEQISAGWDDKPCQAPKTPPNNHDAMHSTHWDLMCVALVLCSLVLGATKAISQTGTV